MEASDSSSSPPWASEPSPSGGPGGQSPADAHAAAAESDTFSERPEVFVGAAFAGGLVLAGVLRWLGR